MATLVLTAVGTAIAGPIGGVIGSAIGGAIDQELFGEPVEGPRLTDLRVTASTYGAHIPIVYGPENRLAGNIIWSTGLIETKNESTEGGLFGIGGTDVVRYTYSTSLAIALCEGPVEGSIKRIYANGKVIFDIDNASEVPAIDPVDGQVITKTITKSIVSPDLLTGDELLGSSGGGGFSEPLINSTTEMRGSHSVFETLTFYPGNKTQEANARIEADKGVGNVSGYRNTCYVVIEDLQLADFGNRIPNLEFELEAHTQITTAEIADDISTRSGIDLVSTSTLKDTVRGYMITRQGSAYNALVPLGAAFNFDIVEQNGDVRFISRAKAMKATVPIEHMRAALPGQQPQEPIRYTNESDLSLPDEVSVTYRDPDMNFQDNTQRAFRNAGTSNNRSNQALPITLSSDDARQSADRLLWGAWSGRKTATFAYSDTWVRRSPGDILGLPIKGQVVPYKLIRATRGNNGVIQVEARFEDPEIYNSQAIGAAGDILSNTLRQPGPTIMLTVDMPLLSESDDGAGFYWAVTATSQHWRGAEIQRSEDNGTSYEKVSDSLVTATIGNVTTRLLDGPTEFWDRGNTLTVELIEPGQTLESLTELEVLNGGNAAWIGPSDGSSGEIIQFATATLVGTRTYRLSNLLRGRLGTERNTAIHGDSDKFMLIQRQFIGLSDFGVGDWDEQRLYRPVSFFTEEASADSFGFTNTGVLSKPYSPTDPRGSRDGSNNLTITWKRRTRYRSSELGGGPVPLGEESEAYEIDILDGSDSVLRTIETTIETATYTAAQQTTDGLTPGDFVTMDIYQISATRGRGFAKRAII